MTADLGTGVSPLVVNEMTCREAALWYLARGLRPIPWIAVQTDGRWRKRVPFAGFHYVTYTVDQGDIERWDPTWQVGLALAEPGGYWALDVDSYAELRVWEAEHGAGMGPGASWRQTTGRDDGGEHRLYRHDQGGTWPRDGAFSARFEHLEIVSKGLLAVSPSVHPSGRRYAWQPDSESAGLREAGPLLLSYLNDREALGSTGSAAGQRTTAGKRLDVGALLRGELPEGLGHDDTLTRLVFQYVQEGRSDEEIALVWRTVANQIQSHGDPFEPGDYQRHLDGARRKLAEHRPLIVEDWMWDLVYSWMGEAQAGRPYGDGAPHEPGGVELASPEHQLKTRERWRLEARDTYQRDRAAEAFSVPGPDRLVTLAAGLALPQTERRYLVSGLIGAQHNVTVTAGYKTGKTTMIGNLVRSLADEIPFLGFSVSEFRGRVGFWNLEMDADDLYEYWRPLGVEHADRVVIAQLRGDRIPFMSSGPARDWTLAWLRDNEISVWIVDSWTRLCNGWHGIAEKDNAGYAALTSEIDKIKAEAGVDVFMATCHMPRAEMAEGQERARGGAALDDWVDARWVMTRQGDVRYLYAEGRGVRLEETALTFDQGSGILGRGEGSRAEARDHDDPREVLEFIRLNPDADTQSIKDGLPFAAQRVTNAINHLLVQGLIIRERRGRSFHHQMVPLPS